MSKVSNLNENKKLDIKTALTLVLKSEKSRLKAVMAAKFELTFDSETS